MACAERLAAAIASAPDAPSAAAAAAAAARAAADGAPEAARSRLAAAALALGAGTAAARAAAMLDSALATDDELADVLSERPEQMTLLARDLAAHAARSLAARDDVSTAPRSIVRALLRARRPEAAERCLAELRILALAESPLAGAAEAYCAAVGTAAAAGADAEPLVRAELGALIASRNGSGALRSRLLAPFVQALAPRVALAPAAAVLCNCVGSEGARAALDAAGAVARASPAGAAAARELLAEAAAAAAAERSMDRACAALALAAELSEAGVLDLAAWIVALAQADDDAEAQPNHVANGAETPTPAGGNVAAPSAGVGGAGGGMTSAGALASAAGRQLLAAALTTAAPAQSSGAVLRAQFAAARALARGGVGCMQDFADLAATRLRDLSEPLHAPQRRPDAQSDAGVARNNRTDALGGGKYTAEELTKARAYALSIVEEFERTGAIAASVVQSARHWQRQWWQAAVVPALLAVGSEGDAVGVADAADPAAEVERIERAARCADALANIRLLSAAQASALRKRADTRAEAAALGLGGGSVADPSDGRLRARGRAAQPVARTADGRQLAATLARVRDAARSADEHDNAQARAAIWPLIDDAADALRSAGTRAHANAGATGTPGSAAAAGSEDMAAQLVGWMVDQNVEEAGNGMRTAVSGVVHVLASAPRGVRVALPGTLMAIVGRLYAPNSDDLDASDSAAAADSEPCRRGLVATLAALAAYRSTEGRGRAQVLAPSQASGASAPSATVPSIVSGLAPIASGDALAPVIRARDSSGALTPARAASGPDLLVRALDLLPLGSPRQVARAVELIAEYVAHVVKTYAFIADGDTEDTSAGNVRARRIVALSGPNSDTRGDGPSQSKRARTDGVVSAAQETCAAYAPQDMLLRLEVLSGRARVLAIGNADADVANACRAAALSGDSALRSAERAGILRAGECVSACTRATVVAASRAHAGTGALVRESAVAEMRATAIAADPPGAVRWLIACAAENTAYSPISGDYSTTPSCSQLDALGPGVDVVLRVLADADAARLACAGSAWLPRAVIAAMDACEGELPACVFAHAAAAADLVVRLPPAALIEAPCGEHVTNISRASRCDQLEAMLVSLTSSGAVVGDVFAAHVAAAVDLCMAVDEPPHVLSAALALCKHAKVAHTRPSAQSQSMVRAAAIVDSLFRSGGDAVKAAHDALACDGRAPGAHVRGAIGSAVGRMLVMLCEGGAGATGVGVPAQALVPPAVLLRARPAYRAGRVASALRKAARVLCSVTDDAARKGAEDNADACGSQNALSKFLFVTLAGAVAADPSLALPPGEGCHGDRGDDTRLFDVAFGLLHALGLPVLLRALGEAALAKPEAAGATIFLRLLAGLDANIVQVSSRSLSRAHPCPSVCSRPCTRAHPVSCCVLTRCCLLACRSPRTRARAQTIAADAARLTGRRGVLAALATAAAERVRLCGVREFERAAGKAKEAVLAVMRATT